MSDRYGARQDLQEAYLAGYYQAVKDFEAYLEETTAVPVKQRLTAELLSYLRRYRDKRAATPGSPRRARTLRGLWKK